MKDLTKLSEKEINDFIFANVDTLAKDLKIKGMFLLNYLIFEFGSFDTQILRAIRLLKKEGFRFYIHTYSNDLGMTTKTFLKESAGEILKKVYQNEIN